MSNSETREKSIVLVIAAAIVAVALGLGLNQVGSGFAARTSEGITVTGSARVDAKADKVVWTLNAEFVSPTQSVAVTRVTSSVEEIVKYLNTGGISGDAIEFGSLSAYGQEEYMNGSSTGRISSYRASRTVTVRTSDVETVKKLSTELGTLIAAGVNVSNYGPQYYVSKLSDLRPELLEQAVRDAKVRAEAIVAATGGKVGNVMSVRSGPFQVTSPDSVDTSAGGFYDTSTIDKTITSTVTVVFKVKS
ncbi:MAG: SIMPL domain-containing protein [Actinomycetota bacterium]